MTITIETGTGDNPAANSYVTEAELTSYAAARGVTLSADPATLLIKAMDYAETLPFPGQKTSEDQPLQWPRKNVRLDGYAVPDNMIPAALKNAQLITAVAIDQGRDPLAPIEPGIKREKVDVLEISYQDGASSRALDVAISRAWAKLVKASGGTNQIPVSRG